MRPPRFPTFALFALALFFAVAVVACGDGASSGGGGGGAGATGGEGGGPGTGGTGGSGPLGCKSIADCGAGQICDEASGRCVAAPSSCEEGAECGPGAICTDGACVQNQTGGTCGGDGDCPSRERCIGGYCGCMGGDFQAEVVPPNVLIVLDKSGSMRNEVDRARKWDIAYEAIEGLLAAYGDQIRFGLVLYPDGSRCDPGQVLVDVELDNATEILGALDASGPDGSTPTAASLEAILQYDGLADPSRENYVLLVTDGDERCGGDGEAAVQALRSADPQIKTFVVGFGGGVDADELNAMAVAAGTDLPGDDKYYRADDAASLAEAFQDIGGEVLSCSYAVEDTGLDLGPSDIFVYFDGRPISHDASETDGWVYEKGSSQITFHGDACTSLRRGEVNDLVIVHGCPIRID